MTDSTYWIKQDGVLLTITGTVNESAKAGDVSEFKIQAIGRETKPGSSTKYDKVTFVNVDADGVLTSYDTVLSDGSVTVIADGTTTTEAVTGTTTTNTGETTTTSLVNVNYGDTNLDGVVDLRDAIILNKHLAQQIILEKDSQPFKNADVNADGNVDDQDSSILIDYVIQLIDTLPYTG